MKNLVSYEPDNVLKKSYLQLFREIVNEIRNNRWLMWQLFRREFLSHYKQSLVGIFWAFIMPIVSLGAFVLLNHSGVLNLGEFSVPYPLFALLGMAFWQLFATGLLYTSNSLVKAGRWLIKINFSRKSLVIACWGESLVTFLIQMTLVGFLFFWYKIKPSVEIIFLPLFILPLILFTLGFGLIFSLLNGLMRDVGNILPVLLTFLMFLTPVFYTKPKIGILTPLTRFNPLYYLISVPRDLILAGSTVEWRGFLITSGVSFMIFLISLLIFHLTETRIAERI